MGAESNAPVYIALIEVAPLEGCFLDPKVYAGASVRCYVAEDSEEHAIDSIIAALDEMRLRLVDIEWCVDEAAVEWENPNDQTGLAFVSEAGPSKDVIFGEFHAWPPE